MDLEPGGYGPFDDDLDLLLRLQTIVLMAVEGNRDDLLNKEYLALRTALTGDDTYGDLTPSLVRRHRDLMSMWPALKSISPQWEPRRIKVREQFEPLLDEAEKIKAEGNLASTPHPQGYDPSSWTGAKKSTERLAAVRTLLPVARAAVEQLIADLERPNHNGAPPLDETEDALKHLRQLHKALGEIIEAAASGRLEAQFNSGLVVEAGRYARRAAKALKNDPIPYALSATVLATMSACGVPGIAGWLAGVAISIKKPTDKKESRAAQGQTLSYPPALPEQRIVHPAPICGFPLLAFSTRQAAVPAPVLPASVDTKLLVGLGGGATKAPLMILRDIRRGLLERHGVSLAVDAAE